MKAAGGLLSKILEWGANSQTDAAKEAQADKVIKKTYDTFKGNFTDNTVKVLRVLDDETNLLPTHIRPKLYPDLALQAKATATAFDAEFRYRLEYLCLYGVVRHIGDSEYGITQFGKAFLKEARGRKHYLSVMS